MKDKLEKNSNGKALALPTVTNDFVMKGFLSQDAKFTFLGQNVARSLGYSPGEMAGKSLVDFIYPGDHLPAYGFLALLKHDFKEHSVNFRFRTSANKWVWLEMTAKNQLYNPRVNGFVFSITNISGPTDIQEENSGGEHRFKSLFYRNPDIFYYENRDGVIEDVNRQAESYGYTREELIGQYGPGLLSNDMASVYCNAFKEVLKGKASPFEFEIIAPDRKSFLFDAKKIPVEINGEVVGVFTIARDMTELRPKNNSRELARGKHVIFENITDACFILDKNWMLCYINHEFDRLLGTNRVINTGRNIWEVFPEEYGKDLYEELNKAFETGRVVHFETFLQKSGRWLEIKAYPSKKGLSVYFTDITERVKNENELKKLSIVASKTKNGVLILDQNWAIEWVNDAFSNVTGLEKPDVIGMNILGVFDIPEDDIKKIREGKPVKVETEFARPAVPPVWLNLDISPESGEKSGPSCLLVLITDITLQKQEAQEKNRFVKELQEQNNSLQQFSHIVSHNLRAPVNNILGLTKMFDLPEEDAFSKKEIIKNLNQAAQNLDTIITDLNQILSYRGSIDNISENIPMEKSFSEVLELLRPQIEKEDALIHSSFKVKQVKTVKSYLDSIFFNLISNALKFKSKERRLEINVSSFNEGNFTVLMVRDNGIGIDLEKHGNAVFGLYKRFHAHLQGRGIGLFLVKTQIESQGGKVEVESKVGEGTAFKVYFPVVVV